MILDGWGIGKKDRGNAYENAESPNIHRLYNDYPHTSLACSGMAVGLPEGQMGNSEVGHLNIGAGRIIYQEFTRINKEIEEEGFFKNEAFLNAIKNVRDHNSQMHLYGLLSDGGVHSHIDHLKALLRLCKEKGLQNVYVHCFLDGRDTPPQSGKEYLSQLEEYIKELGIGRIATISGRYYAMDRDKRWERIQLAYDAMVRGKGEAAASAISAIEESYKENRTDEFVLPTVIMNDGKPVAKIQENDSIIFFNFRPDRAREITRTLVDPDFNGFDRNLFPLYYVCMTQYDATMPNVHVAYLPEVYKNTLGEYIASKGLKQLRIAETEKYAHVTFFFNGGVEKPNKNEDRALIPSPKVATYDLQPEMSAYEVTDRVLQEIDKDYYDLIIINFANLDMVGHTGVFNAAKSAVEALDKCVGKVVSSILEKGGAVYMTADHGNAEQMYDYETGEPFTAHTTNPVPFVVIGEGDVKLREGGRLSDIAPTMLDFMRLPIPVEMTGKSLISK
jgi:2,3-bisphosphoglycerate-independent phosphoglycerate mutase